MSFPVLFGTISATLLQRYGPEPWFQDGGRSEIEGSQLVTIEVALTESYADIEHGAPSEHLLQRD